VNIQRLVCLDCGEKTPHVEELDETYLSCWRCLFCNKTQRPGGNSMVMANRPRVDDPGSSANPGSPKPNLQGGVSEH
jgi:hypothetical protein